MASALMDLSMQPSSPDFARLQPPTAFFALLIDHVVGLSVGQLMCELLLGLELPGLLGEVQNLALEPLLRLLHGRVEVLELMHDLPELLRVQGVEVLLGQDFAGFLPEVEERR